MLMIVILGFVDVFNEYGNFFVFFVVGEVLEVMC